MTRIIALAALSTLLVACGDAADAPADDGPAAGGTTASASSSTASAGAGGGATSGAGGGATTGSGGSTTAVAYPDPDWAMGAPEDHGLDPAKLEEAAAAAEGTGSYCLLVIRDGVLVYERYWNGHDAATPQRSWSIAKSHTSALVGIAIDRGDLAGLDTPVSQYVPEWQGGERAAITLRHLVSMTSGLEWSAFKDYGQMVMFTDDHTEFAVDLDPDAAVGSEWTYHNGAVQVLERVFQNATGGTIEAYAQQHLWSRLGNTNTTWAHDPAGNPTAYASVMATCRDHARLGYLYRHGGTWAGGEHVVPAAWVEQTLTPSQEHNRAYGLLWWLNAETPALDAMMEPFEGRMVPFAPPDLFAMRGFGNQFVDVIPSLELMVVRFGPDPMNELDMDAFAYDQRFGTHDAILAPVLEAVMD